ncbi:MAG: mechanosensitive ion channel [Candidatus Caldarchaeum sp.]
MLAELGWLSSQAVWLVGLTGLLVVVRLVLGPLADIVSPRLGGFLRMAATVSLVAAYSTNVFEFLQIHPAYGVLFAAGALTLAAFGFKPVKQVFVGDMLKAAGVLREGDYVVVDGQTARIAEVDATHTVLITSDLRKLFVPNDHFLTKQYVNMTKSGAGVLTVRITVNGRQISMADAKLILLKTGTDLAKGEMAPNRAAEVRVEKIEGDYVTLRLTLYLMNPAKAEALASHIMERVYVKLAEVATEAMT